MMSKKVREQFVCNNKANSTPKDDFHIQAEQESARLEARRHELLAFLAPHEAELQRITEQLAALACYLRELPMPSSLTGRQTFLVDQIAAVLSQCPQGLSTPALYKRLQEHGLRVTDNAVAQCLWRHKHRFTAIERGVYTLANSLQRQGDSCEIAHLPTN